MQYGIIWYLVSVLVKAGKELLEPVVENFKRLTLSLLVRQTKRSVAPKEAFSRWEVRGFSVEFKFVMLV